ncbi:HD domain-containing protein [Candidatus Woesearchaeota archaeon]|jgi:HD-GYP domain-containing protein (c-di-GMP phosphodiesterase class II)|nr:HD domain-containing protein [Candidatus Woesearchaeota archaeon]
MLGQGTYNKLVRIPGISAILTKYRRELPFEDIHAHSLFELVHAVATGMNLGTEETETLDGAALVHDCGKLLRPDFYNSTDIFSEDERSYVRLHTRFGHLIMDEHKIPEKIATIADGHHEHCSDRYPRDVYSNGHDIPDERRRTDPEIFFLQQVFCACDFIDAQLRDRSYRAARPIKEVTEELQRDFRGETRIVEAIQSQNLKQMYN